MNSSESHNISDIEFEVPENVDDCILYKIDFISEINIHIIVYIYLKKTGSHTLNDYVNSDCIFEGECYDLKYHLDNFPGPLSTFANYLASASGSFASTE